MVKTIVVVDDSKVQCKHAIGLCESLVPEAQLDSFNDGSDALNYLRRAPVDIVILDLEMPVMDGVQLAGFIAAENLAKSIVICSAKDPMLIASVSAMSESSGLRVLGTIHKPICEQSLQQCFDKFILADFVPQNGEKTFDEFSELSEQDLRSAISNNEVTLFFQPKVTTKGVLLKGVEALARWKHPYYGYIPPPVFISKAEQLGLIDELTINLIEYGVRTIKQRQNLGLRIETSFNLSPQSIGREGFSEHIENQIVSSGIDPKIIIFEVTENMLLQNVSVSLQSLARLRLHGFGISIDDFGAGFANADQLARLPATELKIDRSLVNGASKKWLQRSILESTVKMAQNLSLVTVAEGVEDLDDYLLVKELGVDIVQGFYFAKPMCEDDFCIWKDKELSMIRKKIRNG